ncbi:transposase [Desulfogranum japonicum]|uniref:transposase n=1 Tax=Desulfogranum japonicum TaxID=231447 RepID=UPI000422D5C9|nr:transposase [Desulfogranum japonicum]
MARLARVSPARVPVHVIQRGNNRQVCFASEEDYVAYIGWLAEYAKKYHVEIHAWVLMTNHVHLLCTPLKEGALSFMMQSLGRSYVRYFNKEYERTGTLWEGRYKSCLVQSELYLLEVYRYIELNPVRAEMVTDPGEYVWSSYRTNALGVSSNLCTPHAEYLSLGKTANKRKKAYLDLFRNHLGEDLIGDIRLMTNKGLALGNSRFKGEIEVLTGRRVVAKKRGRPAKSCKENI